MYKSIQIQNFRGLRDLRIEDLGRVNLLVGANNVGKTSVLEALALLHMHRNGYELNQILESRGYRRDASIDGALSTMIAGRGIGRFTVDAFAADHRNRLIGESEFHPDRPEAGTIAWRSASLSEREQLQIYYVAEPGNGLETFSPETLHLSLDVDRPFPPAVIESPFGSLSFLPSRFQFSPSGMADLITKAEERGGIESLVRSLSAFDDRIVDLYNGYDLIQGKPTVNVRVSDSTGHSVGLPIAAIGDGSKRMLEILLFLPLASGGLGLVDEMETGIYFENLPRLWKAVGAVAQDSQIQVIATTHSWECVEAAVKAFRETPEDFRLHRLQRKGDDVSVVTYDHEAAEATLSVGVEFR